MRVLPQGEVYRAVYCLLIDEFLETMMDNSKFCSKSIG